MKLSEVIDLLAASTAPVAAWTAICQSFGKPWAHSGFIALGTVSVGLWIVKTAIQAKRKNARCAKPKRSKCNRNNKSKKIIAQNQRKRKYEYKIPVYLREGKGYAHNYRKREM